MNKKVAAVCLASAMLALSLPVSADDRVDILTKQDETSEDSFLRISRYLHVILDENPVAAERIMEGYQAMYFEPRETEIQAFIEEEKEFFSENFDLKKYEFGDEIRCGRADENVISLCAEYWKNTGGPHPNSEYRGAVFSAKNGQILSLSDLLVGDGTSAEKLLVMVKNKLKEQYGEHLYKGQSAEEYAAAAVSKQDSWYLTENGLVFFFDPGEIAPYAAGLIEVELLYGELGEIMQAQYLEMGDILSVEEYGWADGCVMLWNDVLENITGWFE